MRPNSSPPKTADDIREDVLRELAWDTRVGGSALGVEVQGTFVILTGTVSSFANKVAAEAAAHRVSGVCDVANDVDVQPDAAARHDDLELVAAIRNGLAWDVLVPDELIHVTVSAGYVNLRGCVDTHAQREDAERAARNLAGVRAVSNEILVLGSDASPGALLDAIRQAFERHADGEDGRIELEVDGGRVTLRGHVSSWREREAIVCAATGTRGVESVVDRLVVR